MPTKLVTPDPTHPAPPAKLAKRYCRCQSFAHLVGTGIMKFQTHQIMNTTTGQLDQLTYYYLGPKDLRKCVIPSYCPGCGKKIKLNEDFLARVMVKKDNA